MRGAVLALLTIIPGAPAPHITTWTGTRVASVPAGDIKAAFHAAGCCGSSAACEVPIEVPTSGHVRVYHTVDDVTPPIIGGLMHIVRGATMDQAIANCTATPGCVALHESNADQWHLRAAGSKSFKPCCPGRVACPAGYQAGLSYCAHPWVLLLPPPNAPIDPGNELVCRDEGRSTEFPGGRSCAGSVQRCAASALADARGTDVTHVVVYHSGDQAVWVHLFAGCTRDYAPETPGTVYAVPEVVSWGGEAAAAAPEQLSCGPGTTALGGECVPDHPAVCHDGLDMVDGHCRCGTKADPKMKSNANDCWSDGYAEGFKLGESQCNCPSCPTCFSECTESCKHRGKIAYQTELGVRSQQCRHPSCVLGCEGSA